MNAVNLFAQWWWTWMVSMTWQVGLLIAIIACLDLLIRRWIWPQVRYALWLMVLIKLIVPPGLSLHTSLVTHLWPRNQISAQPTPETVAIESPISSTIETDALVGPPTDSIEPRNVPEPRRVRKHAIPARPSEATSTSAPVPTPQPRIHLPWQVTLCGAWFLGAMTLSLWLIRRLRYLRQESSLADPHPLPESFYDLAHRCAQRIGLHGVPEIRVTSNLNCPAVTGWVRPILLMPVGFLSKLSRQDTEHMLLHEFAHVKRGDMVVHAFYLSLQIVYWYNPLLWWVGRRLFHLREICCDATVAGLLKEKTMEYRRTLLDIARHTLVSGTHPGLGLLGLFEDSHRLESRLHWLKRDTWRFSRLRWSLILLTVIGMGVFVLPMAQAQPSPEQTAAIQQQAQRLAQQQAALEVQMQQLMEQQKQLQAMMKQLQEQRAMLEAVATQTAPALVTPPTPVQTPAATVQSSVGTVQAVGSAQQNEKTVTVSIQKKQGKDGFQLLRSEIHPLEIAAGATLNLANQDGAITVQGIDGPQYQLMAQIKLNATTEAEAQALSKQVNIKTQKNNQNVSITLSQPKKLGEHQEIGMAYTLLVPKQTNLNLKQEDGDINVHSVTGLINLAQEDGNIKTTQVSGTLNIALEDGNISCDDLKAGVNIVLEDGNIKVNRGQFSSCHIRLEDGEVSCQEISGSLDMSVEDGHVELSYADQPPTSCTIAVAVEDGTIQLLAPASLLPDGFTSYVTQDDDEDDDNGVQLNNDEDDEDQGEDNEGDAWAKQFVRDGQQISISLSVQDGKITVKKK